MIDTCLPERAPALRRSLLPFQIVALAALTAGACEPARGTDAPLILSGISMGTTYAVTITPAPPADRAGEAAATVQAVLDEVDALMSTYDADSELSRLNRHASTEPFAVSPPTMAVFLIAREVSRATAGAFDVTVGPLVALWGFGATDRPQAPPNPAELARARRSVGYQALTLDENAGTIAKSDPAVRCDLSAVAKGYAVDLVVEALEARGFGNFLVEVGGEVAGRGSRPDGSPWRVGIERPGDPGRVEDVVEIADEAMATSGDLGNAYEVGGRRISHLINPRTGQPADTGLASVSVIHPSAARADALATALYVMGRDEGLRYAESEGLAAHFLLRDPSGALTAVSTRAFASHAAGP